MCNFLEYDLPYHAFNEPPYEISTSESEEESDEEMVVQDWRRQRYIRESYLESIKVKDVALWDYSINTSIP